jgi:hypothetical protein
VQKGITVSRSFGKLLSDKDEIRQALLRYVGRAGQKLRRGGLMGERITVFARTDRFNPSRPCCSRMLTTTLPFPTDYTPALIVPALRLFDAIWKPGLGFQKCGVMLTNLVVADRTRRYLIESCAGLSAAFLRCSSPRHAPQCRRRREAGTRACDCGAGQPRFEPCRSRSAR